MPDIFDINYQWLQYLRKVGISEDQLSKVQANEMKKAFVAGMSCCLVLLRDEMPKVREDKHGELLKSLFDQCLEFWLEQSGSQN